MCHCMFLELKEVRQLLLCVSRQLRAVGPVQEAVCALSEGRNARIFSCALEHLGLVSSVAVAVCFSAFEFLAWRKRLFVRYWKDEMLAISFLCS